MNVRHIIRRALLLSLALLPSASTVADATVTYAAGLVRIEDGAGAEYGNGRTVDFEHDGAGNLATVETAERDGTASLEMLPPPLA